MRIEVLTVILEFDLDKIPCDIVSIQLFDMSVRRLFEEVHRSARLDLVGVKVWAPAHLVEVTRLAVQALSWNGP